MLSRNRVTTHVHRLPFFCGVLVIAAMIASSPARAAGMTRFALQGAAQMGFDMAPDFQFGALVDGYLRLTPRFSLGLRSGIVNTLDVADEAPGTQIIPQIPLDLLFSWDFGLPSNGVIIPLTVGSGVSFLPTRDDELFIEMLTIETGSRVRMSEKVWLAILVGGRALMFYNTEYGTWMPHADLRVMVGPYVRFSGRQ